MHRISVRTYRDPFVETQPQRSRFRAHRSSAWLALVLTVGGLTSAGVLAVPAFASPVGSLGGPWATVSSTSAPWMITPGPNGNLWFTEKSANEIDEITPAGVISSFPLGSNAAPWGIVEGPDGNLWFTQSSAAASAIGRITPSGVVTLFTAGLTAGSQPEGITVGPNGNLWFTENTASKIGTITPAGAISEYPVTASSGPTSITTGGDGNLWRSPRPGPSRS